MDTFHHFKEFPEYYNCCDFYCCVVCNFVYKYQGYIQEYGQLPHVFPQSLVPTTDKQQVI